MVRYSEHNTSNIYEAAQAFRDRLLIRDDSLLFDGAAFWLTDLSERIYKTSVAMPDEGDRSFIDTLIGAEA